jgi:hypothetical protein
MDADTAEAPITAEKKRRNPEFYAQAGVGRPKGTPNRYSASVREMVMGALQKAGGVEWFLNLAKGTEGDRRTFAMVAARLIPQEITGQLDTRMHVTIVREDGRVIIDLPPTSHPDGIHDNSNKTLAAMRDAILGEPPAEPLAPAPVNESKAAIRKPKGESETT